MLPLTITPNLHSFEITSIKQGEELIYVSAFSQGTMAPCPLCSQISQRIQRHPSDLPWCGSRLRLELTVGRFFCDNPDCSRRTFAERLPQLLKPHAQKTKRLTQTMYEVAQEAGGEAGSRLGEKLAIVGSPSTYLRIIRRADLNAIIEPRIIGIDDWAWRKRKTYGTIICDLEKSEVIDLLPDCETQTVVTWLKKYPSIEIISRDRAKFFRDAANLGAPQAIQIADRWHLLKNLLDTVNTVLYAFRSKLKIIEVSPESSVVSSQEFFPTTSDSSKQAENWNSDSALSELEKQEIRYKMIWRMRNAGVHITEIVRQTGASRATVFRDLAAMEFSYRKRGGVGSQRADRIKSPREKVWEASKQGLSVDEIVQKFGFSERWPGPSKKE